MFGARLGLWEPIVGFGLVRNYMNPIAYCVIGLSIAGLLYLFAARNCSGVVKVCISGFMGLVLLAPTIYTQLQPSMFIPPIHDISTDVVTPPKFLVLDENRAGARNTLVYGGAEVARHQKKAYSDIAPIESKKTTQAAFVEALRVGKAMGWEIIAQDAKKLRFEATARTPVYQFIDDIVVVVTAVANGSRIDVRSVSRIGRSDRGVNANRIRAFIATFEQ